MMARPAPKAGPALQPPRARRAIRRLAGVRRVPRSQCHRERPRRSCHGPRRSCRRRKLVRKQAQTSSSTFSRHGAEAPAVPLALWKWPASALPAETVGSACRAISTTRSNVVRGFELRFDRRMCVTRLVLVVLLVAVPAIASAHNARDPVAMRAARSLGLVGDSADGRFSFEVDESAGEEHPRIVVRERGRKAAIAQIDPAPGGATRNLTVRFVAGNNLLATWSCGTSCEVGGLHRPRGQSLASFSARILDLSPARNFAVIFDGTAGMPFPGGSVDLLDMRTGRLVSTSKQPDIWNVCNVVWEPKRVTLLPCDARTQAIRLFVPPPT